MAFDFSKPQHQSVKGIAIMFVDTLQNIIRGLWVPLLLILYKFDWSKMVFFGIGVFVLLLVIGIIAYLQYKNFTFFLDEEKEEFVIQKGNEKLFGTAKPSTAEKYTSITNYLTQSTKIPIAYNEKEDEKVKTTYFKLGFITIERKQTSYNHRPKNDSLFNEFE